MKRDLFRRYVWLVDEIRHAKKITFEEIANLWKNSPLNEEHSPLALRTFHNHRDAIEHLFGIRILCDRSDHNQYYVAEDNAVTPAKLKVQMLRTLSLSNLKSKPSNVENRILVDVTPKEKLGLSAIMKAMKQNKRIRITYSTPTGRTRTEVLCEPYCVRFWNRTWYLLANNCETGKMEVFDLDRVINISTTDENFCFDENFTPDGFFSNYYGMDIVPKPRPVPVRLRVGGDSREMIRIRPLHPSQKEVLTEPGSSVFEFMFVPGDDFKKTILGMGTDVEVLGPGELRDEVSRRIRSMAENYA